MNAETLAGATRLKVLSTVSVGFDAFDIDYLNQHGILLTNTPDVLTESTADTAFSLVLLTARRLAELDAFVKAGKWTKKIGEDKFGVDVHHKTLGIVGLGRIGTSVARRAALGFEMKVLYVGHGVNERAEREYGAKKVELEELLSTSDFVLLQPPLTAETRNLIGTPQLKAMKRSAFLINASRGQIVDEAGARRGAQRRHHCRRRARCLSGRAALGRVAAPEDEQRGDVAAYRIRHTGDATRNEQERCREPHQRAERHVKVKYGQSGSVATLRERARWGEIEGPSCVAPYNANPTTSTGYSRSRSSCPKSDRSACVPIRR